MSVRILFFAAIREQVGRESLELDAEHIKTVRDAWNHLQESTPQLAPFGPGLLFAVNQDYATPDSQLKDGDELAIFPPVSGGAGGTAAQYPIAASGDIFQMVCSPILFEALLTQLSHPSAGAVVSFRGTVRNNSCGRETLYLEYEGYEPMALKKLEEIGAAIRNQWEVNRVGIVHRLGRLEIGETSVAIIICAPHRHSAFEACRFAIDTLKMIVPIWKKEFFAHGEIWVEGKPCTKEF